MMDFKEFLIAETGQNWDMIECNLLMEGFKETEIREKEDELIEKYQNYCEEHNIDPQIA